MKRTLLKRKTPLERVKPLTGAGSQALRNPRDPNPERFGWDRQAWGKSRSTTAAAFKARTPASRHLCARCGGRASTWHHWVQASAIRREMPRNAQAKVLRDERNLTALCHPCHMHGEAAAGSRRFTAVEIPSSAWEFARELGLWAVIRLERYPA